jgi:hypothetical protein
MEQDPVRVFASVHFHRRFKFQKRRQLFIRSQNETLSVAAMCVNNPDCWSLRKCRGTGVSTREQRCDRSVGE